jgi:hypothetical protein
MTQLFAKLLALSLLFTVGCAAAIAGVTATCQVIGVLDDACLLIPVSNAGDAGVHYVACSGKEMKAWGQELENRRLHNTSIVADTGTE